VKTGSKTRRIEPEFRTKIWGSPRIGPWFEAGGGQLGGADERIGEVWFPAGDLLLKFLFTSEKLSVQVHPDDAYARRHANSRGKTEMWYILRADPGAVIALGFKEPVSPDQVIPAAESGAIMGLLNWIEVHPGEAYFVPSGTVHALGAGLALCEIQQNSDLTYRLFDYGRDRELHLRPASEVLFAGCHPGRSMPRDLGDGVQLLAECQFFRTYSALVDQPKTLGSGLSPRLDARLLVILEGAGRVNGVSAGPGHVFETTEPHEWVVDPEKDPKKGLGTGSMKLLLVA
jgi:mannose-6-phosphate isomerase